MPRYRYQARDEHGRALEGDIEAGSPDAVAGQLINSGFTPIQVEEVKERNHWWADLERQLNSKAPGADDLILFCRQMYSLLKAGVPILRGIGGLVETTRNSRLADALREIRSELESGRELSAAMNQHPKLFTPLMISMVQVGENTGRIDEAFLQLARHLELERDTRNRIKTALRYPTFVLIALAIALAVVNIWVIPAFSGVFAGMGANLPWQTRVLVATSDLFVAWWPAMLVGLLTLLGAARYYVGTDQGRLRWDTLKLHLPIVGSIIKRATLARFARTFAMTVSSGVPLSQALSVVARAVDNTFVGEHIISMRHGVERGDTLTRTAQNTALFTPLVIQMMDVGEETGAVDRLMEEVADFYEREVDYELKTLSSAIEPILIIGVGILVLILALGIFLPMWDLAAAVR